MKMYCCIWYSVCNTRDNIPRALGGGFEGDILDDEERESVVQTLRSDIIRLWECLDHETFPTPPFLVVCANIPPLVWEKVGPEVHLRGRVFSSSFFPFFFVLRGQIRI